MKHTPGPWCVKPYNWQRGNVSVFAPKFGRAPYGACVAYTPCSDGVGGEAGALANARLIAAAPDLLEALRAIVHAATVHACHHALSVDGQQFYDIARSAIKAVEEEA